MDHFRKIKMKVDKSKSGSTALYRELIYWLIKFSLVFFHQSQYTLFETLVLIKTGSEHPQCQNSWVKCPVHISCWESPFS